MLARPVHGVSRLSLVGVVTTGIVLSSFATAEPAGIAFLAAEASLQEMGPHNRAAWESAKALGDATLLLAGGKDGFVDTTGAGRDLADFDVLWYHQGDAIRRTSLYGGPGLATIRGFAEKGRGVLLSGGALAMVAQLGLEKEVRAQRRELENFRDPAAMVPVERSHPVFAGPREEAGLVWLSRGGCRAVADFYWGGPGDGMLLANTPAGVQKPLVEYTLGNGRVIVFGWLWPDYADVESPYRANLVKLTSNLLAYLTTLPSWRPVVIRSKFPPVAFPDVPGVAAPSTLGESLARLRSAVDDPAPRGSSGIAAEFPRQHRLGADGLRKHVGNPFATGAGRQDRDDFSAQWRSIHGRSRSALRR